MAWSPFGRTAWRRSGSASRPSRKCSGWSSEDDGPDRPAVVGPGYGSGTSVPMLSAVEASEASAGPARRSGRLAKGEQMSVDVVPQNGQQTVVPVQALLDQVLSSD